MSNTLFFGNGINRVSDNAVSWDDLLDKIKGINHFLNGDLPNTMVYERIFMEKNASSISEKANEFHIKELIANEMRLQISNDIFNELALLDVENYLTTNYDYTFEKALDASPNRLSTEEIYSLRRKIKYESASGIKYLWNIHGEIEQPKSIMLGLDHYCGSVSKIDSYVKGKYKYMVDGEEKNIEPMTEKLKSSSFCFTSWIDLFFSTNIHIIGFSLDYSEIDIWWLLNKRARFFSDGLVSNKIYFYANNITEEKEGLLKSFNVEVIKLPLTNKDYKNMYRYAISKMGIKSK